MKYDDLEKTMDLFDIEDVPSPIEDIETEGVNKDNLTDEFTLGLTDKEEELPKEAKPKKEKKSLKEKWKNLSKKKKIIIITSIIVLLIAIAVILFFVLKDDKKKEETKEPEVPQVIVEKENYIYKNGELTFLDSEENSIGTYKCKNADEEKCFVVNYNDEDNFNTPKNVYEDETLIERRSKIYFDKYVFIYDNEDTENGVIILYNMEESIEEGVYTLVKGFSDSDYVILKNSNNKYGSLEFTEEGIKEKIDFTFDYLGMQDKESKIVAKTNDKYFIYNKDGKLESKGLNDEIKSYNNKYIVVDNDGYYVYDYKSNLVFDGSFDYVSLLDNYAALIKDKELFIRDYKNNKYNEEGIKINNANYIETNIYDKDKVLIESKKAFKIELVENNLEITYYTKTDKEKTETISVNDGKLSANYTYLNYFDGKLYFYNDEEETNLIGTYECSNKNNIESDTKKFSNCLIASDSYLSNTNTNSDETEIGWVPIFNEQYVFINDSIDIKNPTIVLYDLKNNKTLSKYASVDTTSYTKETKVTFKTVDDNTYIIAKNKSKNKFGVIKIEEEVKSAIPFNYESIEKLSDYYMASESSGTYLLLNNKGEEVTSKYGYKILDYKNNYLIVIDKDNKYYVYDFNGNKVDDTGYLYITLYDSYYAVVTSEKKLDIREYNNPNFKLEQPIDLGTEDYKNAYEVSKSTSGYIIKIKSTNQTINIDTSSKTPTDNKETTEQSSSEKTPSEVTE